MATQRASDLALFLHLARACEQRRKLRERDKYLVLAGATAALHGLHTIAGCCRRKILAQNPGHMIGRLPSFAAGLADHDFAYYVAQLQRTHPRERLEHLLATQGIDLDDERAAYASDAEYAAAILGTTLQELEAADRRVTPPQGAPLPPARTNWRALAVWLAVLGALLVLAAWLVMKAGW